MQLAYKVFILSIVEYMLYCYAPDTRQSHAVFPWTTPHCYLEINLHYLKTLNC